MNVYPGNITISRRSGGGDGDDRIVIAVEDESSGCRLIEVDVSPREFALAITGLACRPCSFEYYPECPVGKVREHKAEDVFVEDIRREGVSYREGRALNARAAVRPLEVDGWEGRDDDAMNHHKAIRGREAPAGLSGSWHRVGYVRFVDPPGDRGRGDTDGDPAGGIDPCSPHSSLSPA